MSRFTPERVGLAQEIINRYPVARSALIPLLHLAQEQDGYVTDDAMEHVAELVGCTPAEVYGTATFYEMFKFHPVGKYVVGICTNISCLLEGAEELLEHAERTLRVKTGGTTSDGMFTLEDVECIAACTLAPCLQVNYRYFPNVTSEGFERIVAGLRGGELESDVPPHGTLGRVRQRVAGDRWAGSGGAPPRLAEEYPGPALSGDEGGAHSTDSAANEPSSASPAQSDHGEHIGRVVDGDRPKPPSPGAEPTR